MIISTSEEVASFRQSLSGCAYVAVDTEFLWEKTYRPTLCLIQIAGGREAAAIDVLAPGVDLSPIYGLLVDPGILKVFHSASQDLEILYGVSGYVPRPVFDTQIAATVCGYGEQPSYAHLVQEILGVKLDKSAQHTDWSLRPLDKSQIEYAIKDVLHLGPVYEALDRRLSESGRRDWVVEDMARLEDEGAYRNDPRSAWRKVRMRRPTRRALAILREMAEWREKTAMRRNLPRPWVMKDGALSEIALNAPESPERLARVRDLPRGFSHRRDARDVLDAVKRALALPPDEWPELKKTTGGLGGSDTEVALLHALLKLRCEEHGVAQRMVASRNDLARLASGDLDDVKSVRGWRRAVFGEDALALMEGKIALTRVRGEVRAVRELGRD